jgi:hypothetical protein
MNHNLADLTLLALSPARLGAEAFGAFRVE